MTKVFIHPYKTSSRSARALAQALSGKIILDKGRSAYRKKDKHFVINWGSSLWHTKERIPLLNRPIAVGLVSNKKTFFENAANFRSVPYTTSQEEAQNWYDEGCIVVGRKKLTGHSGNGIIIYEPDMEEELEGLPLYTKYVKKAKEYRIHIMKDKVIDFQRKILNPETDIPKEEINWKVRNHAGGFIFVRNNVEPEEDVIKQALKAMSNFVLDFGAVDVIWNEHLKKAFVLEINTAPGLQGTTLDVYVKAFKDLMCPRAED